MMFHVKYPPVHETELVFWKYKSYVVLDDNTVYDKYRYGRGTLKALESLPFNLIVQNRGIIGQIYISGLLSMDVTWI